MLCSSRGLNTSQQEQSQTHSLQHLLPCLKIPHLIRSQNWVLVTFLTSPVLVWLNLTMVTVAGRVTSAMLHAHTRAAWAGLVRVISCGVNLTLGCFPGMLAKDTSSIVHWGMPPPVRQHTILVQGNSYFSASLRKVAGPTNHAL